MDEKIRVLIVDDHPVVRQGLGTLLSDYNDINIVAEAGDGPTALRSTEKLAPEVVLLDIRMPGSNGIQITRRLKDRFKETKVIILTTYEEDEYLFGALEAGADGYLLKTASADELSSAIRQVKAGHRLLSPNLMDKVMKQFESVTREKVKFESGLSSQELKVLALAAEGATNKEIAERLYWSEITVKRKLQDIIHKLGATDRTQAVAEAIRRGLI